MPDKHGLIAARVRTPDPVIPNGIADERPGPERV